MDEVDSVGVNFGRRVEGATRGLKVVHVGRFLLQHLSHVVDEAELKSVLHVDLVFGRQLHAVGVMLRQLRRVRRVRRFGAVDIDEDALALLLVTLAPFCLFSLVLDDGVVVVGDRRGR